MSAAEQGADHIDNVYQDFRNITQITLEMQTQWLSHWLPDSESAEPDTVRQDAMVPQPKEDLEQAKSAA